LKWKAIQNLQAGILLLERGLADGAANRLYYALFQAAVFGLERAGRTPREARPGAKVWDHRIVGDRIVSVRGLHEDGRLFRRMRDLREIADYDSRPVDRRKVESWKHDVGRFVGDVTT
jgi:uncharacterized protein (UPF0332 family)